MANLQTLLVIQAEGGAFLSAAGVPTNYDLSATVGGLEVPKTVAGVYIKIVNNAVVEQSSPAGGAIFVTKVTNPSNNAVAYLNEKPGDVTSLLVSDCAACASSSSPSQKVEIETSCQAPLFVQVCNQAGADVEIFFTSSQAICVDNAGVKTGYLVRDKIIWDSVTGTEQSRVTEYSQNGINWSNTAPTGTISLGSCETAIIDTDGELIYGDVLNICGPNCEDWLLREKIIWDSKTSTQLSKVVEFSQDGVTWSTTGPASYTVGICTPSYNTVEQYLVDDSAPLTIPANSVHSISYKVLNGTINIGIGSTTLEYVKGEADMEEATTLISVPYVFTATPNSCVKVKVIKQDVCA